MPAIRLFDRRTIFGGDDLQFGAFVTAGLRCLQLILLLGPVLAHIAHECRDTGGFWAFLLYDPNGTDDCRTAHLFSILLVSYALASCLYGFASLFLEWRITHWAGVGTPTDTRTRTPKVSYLLELKLVPFSLLLFIVWMTGISAVCFAPSYYECRENEDMNANTDNGNNNNNWLAEEEVIFEDDAALLSSSSIFSRIKLWWVAIFFLLISQVSEVLMAWLFVLHLFTTREDVTANFGAPPQPGSSLLESPYPNHELVEQMWANRCASACQCLGVASCFAFGGRELLGNAEFGDVARALADYLETRGVLDVVPSDVVMGLLILQRLQVERSLQTRRQLLVGAEMLSDLGDTTNQSFEDDEELLVSQSMRRDDLFTPLGQLRPNENEVSSRSILLQTNSADMEMLGEGARYADFALAIYTWVLYLYVHPLTGVPRLASQAGFSCCQSSCRKLAGIDSATSNGRIEGDNLCQSHKAALLLTAGLEHADLVYAHLRSSFTENPYCILLDHEWKSVVVSVRGTFSLEDCVTDVLIEPEPLEEMGQEFGFDGKDQFCHRGVLLCARNVYRDLQRHGLLDTLLLGENARCPGYTLKLVGHSLGASACALLSYMLRGKFPGLRCITYSPPGWSLTWELAVGCQGWCTTFVLDSDLVPRLSQRSMEVLRDEILELIGRVKVPKIEVLNRFVRGVDNSSLCFDPPIDNARMNSFYDILYTPNEIPESEYRHQLERFKNIQQERRLIRGAARTLKMFPPGNMVHLVKTGEMASCCHGLARCITCFTTNAGFVYTPIRIANDSLDEIEVNPHMGTDHFPNRMSSVIRSVASNYGI